jgi:arabinose-5-phosphate isomerase
MDNHSVLDLGRAAIATEAAAVTSLLDRIDSSFVAACNEMLRCKGRIVVVGVGKSGHIAGKIAATLSSTGTPAFFVHPADAGHGDIGMIKQEDLVLALSNSGETREVIEILPPLKRLGVKLIAMTGNAASTLARHADIHLDVSIEKEACTLDLAPTSSTTVALVMGDALAVALLQTRGFTREDFARSHPAGQLGRRLLLHISDIMHSGADIPQVSSTATVSETILEITRKRMGMSAVMDADGKVAGVYTDGDLRRTLDASLDIHTTPITSVMTRGGRSIGPHALASEAAHLMEIHKIQGLLVIDDDRQLVGALNFQDLLKAGVV